MRRSRLRRLIRRVVVCSWSLAGGAFLAAAEAAPFDSDFPDAQVGLAVDCAKARFTPDTTICDNAGLKRLDIQIAAAYRRLQEALKGQDLRILSAGQQLWMIERDMCRNLDTVHGAPGIFECLQASMNKRLEMLNALAANPSRLSATVAGYSYVYESYLNAFGAQYAGKTVNVAGGIDIEACHKSGEHSLVGHLSNRGRSVEIRFKSLPPDQIDFLCSKRPFSWWDGKVRIENGRPYLFASDVLGSPLP